jgi:hypothetical protein
MSCAEDTKQLQKTKSQKELLVTAGSAEYEEQYKNKLVQFVKLLQI